jgi:dihydroorotate dehydrogenase electron transfer subunit
VLLPHADIVVEPVLVTDAVPAGEWDVLACGPEPMLESLRRVVPRAQLAWEAPMACGYGACYGCAVEIGGRLARLCVEGPVISAPAEMTNGRAKRHKDKSSFGRAFAAEGGKRS